MILKITGLSYEDIPKPFETIFEILKKKKISKTLFYLMIGFKNQEILAFENGYIRIDSYLANKISKVIHMSSHFLMNLQYEYNYFLIESLKERNISERELKLFSNVNRTMLNKYVDLIDVDDGIYDEVDKLRIFLGIHSLEEVYGMYFNNVNFRRVESKEASALDLSIWIKYVLNKSSCEVNSIKNLGKVIFALNNIRQLMFLNDISEIEKELNKILNFYGIEFIFSDYDQTCKIQGFLKVDKEKAIICVTPKYKYLDIFWFTFYHELSHLILNEAEGTFVVDEVKEKEVDELAKNLMIDKDLYKILIEKEEFTNEAILEFSMAVNVPVGVVVGRLQKDGIIPYSSKNYLKAKIV